MIANRRKPPSALACVLASLLLILSGCTVGGSGTDDAAGGYAGPGGSPAAFGEPVRLTSEDGVLEVRLSAHQGTVPLDTASAPVSNFLLFGYELIRGTASDGATSGDDLYPAPT